MDTKFRVLFDGKAIFGMTRIRTELTSIVNTLVGHDIQTIGYYFLFSQS